MPGPSAARARLVLCAGGLLTGEEAFGGAVVPRFDDAGQPVPARLLAERRREAEAARLTDEAVMRRWRERKLGGEGIPLDRLCAAGAITERQRLAGMRYARAAWRMVGMAWPKASPVYRQLGMVTDDRAGLMTSDPEREHEADQRAEMVLREAAHAVRVRCGEPALRLVGAVAVYLEDRWIGTTAEQRAGSHDWRRLVAGLEAVADALRVKLEEWA